MGGEQLVEQVIRGVAADADLPQDAAEDVDDERVRRVAVLPIGGRTAGERNAERQGFRIAYTRTKWRLLPAA